MGKDIELLEEEFKVKVVSLLQKCEAKGFKLVPFFTQRDVWDQAKLWRQSRPWPQIEAAIKMLLSNGAPWLASVLEEVGPQFGRWATNSLPGMSWHNYDQAIDSFVLDQANQRAIWNASHDGYRIYAREAVELGLVPGYYWRRRDAVHVQGIQERVREKYNWTQIEQLMKEKFDDTPDPAPKEEPEPELESEIPKKSKPKAPAKKSKKKEGK